MDLHAMTGLIAGARLRPEWDRFSRMTAMDIHRDGRELAAEEMGQELVDSTLHFWPVSPLDPSPASLIVPFLLDEETLREIGRKLVQAVEDDMTYDSLPEEAA